MLDSPYQIRATERNCIPSIETLADQIDRDLTSGECQNWAQVWERYHSTIGTLSLRSEYPTGKVFAEIIDIIESK